jgi:hypothetical protein
MAAPQPQGIETAIRKAQGSASFKAQLLRERAEAAAAAGIELGPAEIGMLNTIPMEQLEAVIESSMPDSPRRTRKQPPDSRGASWGIRPDRPNKRKVYYPLGCLLGIVLMALMVVALVAIVCYWWQQALP